MPLVLEQACLKLKQRLACDGEAACRVDWGSGEAGGVESGTLLPMAFNCLCMSVQEMGDALSFVQS